MPRGHVEFLSLPCTATDSYAFGAWDSGLRGRVLSRDDATHAHTAYLEAAPLWQWRSPGFFDCDIEVLVLTGELRRGEHRLGAGWYDFIAAGEHVPRLESDSGATFLWMSAGSATLTESSAAADRHDASRSMMPIDARGAQWTSPPAFEGRSLDQTISGLSVKWLREDPRTTAYTLLSRHAPGWIDPRLEAHDTWEELLLLDGDYLMGDTGAVEAGTYIFRPGNRPHGPQVTRRGAVWLARGERRIDFELQSPQWAAERAQRYLREVGNAEAPAPQPWEKWL